MFWAITGFSILGTFLNIHKNRWGFAIWMITNLVWAVIDYKAGLIEQTVLFLFYFLTSLWGFMFWSNKAK